MPKREVRSRRKKIEEDIPKPSPKEKFMQSLDEVESMRQIAVPKFVPATEGQKKAVAYLRGGVSVMFLVGSAGTGKSMLAAWWAANLKKEKKVDKIYLIRPAVITGRSAGMLPGTEFEKLEPYFAQTLIHLNTFMGHGYMNYCLTHEEIELKSCEYIRGRSFEDCVVVAEESQNLTKEDLEMMLTRLGKNCTLLLTGDFKQNDLKGNSGLMYTIDLIKKMIADQPDYLANDDLDALEDYIGWVEFQPEDCVRSGLTRSFVKMYHNN